MPVTTTVKVFVGVLSVDPTSSVNVKGGVPVVGTTFAESEESAVACRVMGWLNEPTLATVPVVEVVAPW